MDKLCIAETKLRELDKYYLECEDEHMKVRKKWDIALGKLKESTVSVAPQPVNTSGPLYR